MRDATWIVGGVLGVVGVFAGASCLSSGEGGNIGVVDVVDGANLDAADTAAHDTAAPDTAGDTGAPPDTASSDTIVLDTYTVDIGQDTSAGPICGDGVREGDEACDDGNTCPKDGCDAPSCRPVTTLVLSDLALDPSVAFDLDDADGDHDVTTGGDNRLGGSQLVTSVVNPLITQSIEKAQVIQLVTLAGLDNAYVDPDVALVLHPGVDTACPTSLPPIWIQPSAVVPELLSDRGAWPSCAAPLQLEGEIAASAPSSASPDAPVLVASTGQPVTIPAGPLGDLTVARSHLEAHVVGASGVVDVLALTDGRLSGVIPARTLYEIDTSSLLPGCPTALHAVLALVGHIDQDAEGNGAKDWIQFTLGGTEPCLGDPVTIVGCCNDGDCADFVAGPACALDPKINDGYSAGFRFEALHVRVVGQVDGATYCSP